MKISDEPDCWEIGKGWHPLVEKLIEDLLLLGWDGELEQVKEKFGGLRFYIFSGSDAMFARIDKAEEESYKTCEICGKPGRVAYKNGWAKTLCGRHATEEGY